jgi:gliding motility-associated-like protein
MLCAYNYFTQTTPITYMMTNPTSSTILLPKFFYRKAKAIALALIISSTATSAFAAKPIPVSNNKHVAFAATVSSFSPASGSVGTLITVNGFGLAGATSFAVGSKTALVISSSDTKMVGMVMPGNISGTIKVTAADGTVITARDKFTITETPYPTAPQGSKLVDTSYTRPQNVYNGDVKVLQGLAVAVSADGNAAIVGTGMPFSTRGGAGVIFYKRLNGVWKQDGPEIGSDYFNISSVAISADGNTAVSGGGSTNSPLGVIYARVNGAWAVAGGSNGSKVSISADGNTVMFGKPHNAHILMRQGSTWVETQIPGAENGTGEVNNFPNDISSNTVAMAVAISADSRTAVIAAPGYGPPRTNTYYYPGHTYVYARASATDLAWVLKQSLPEFNAVALNADGRTLLVNNTNVYTRASIGQKFMSATTVPGSGPAAMSADSKTIIYAANGPIAYTLTDSTYTAKPISGPKYAAGTYATSIGLSADGTTAFLGNPGDTTTVLHYPPTNEPTDNTSQLPLGAVYAFTSQAGVGPFSPSSGPVGTLVTVNFSNIAAPTSLKIGGKDALLISKTDNTVTAMVMPGAVTGPVMLGALSAGDNFTVTATPFPNVQNGPKMADTNKYASADKLTYSLEQGTVVAISADGKTAVAASGKSTYSAWYKSQNVVFYAKVNGSWKESRFLTTSYSNSSFPLKAAINADGTAALVVFADAPNSIDPGFVYGYHKNANGEWVPDDQGITGVLGLAVDVSLSADGNTAVTGYRKCFAHGCETHANVFYRVNGLWVGQSEPTFPGSQPDPKYYIPYGQAVAISADGKTIAASALQNGVGTNIYTNTGTAWVLQQGLSTAVGAPTLSADGNILLSGNRLYNRADNKWTYKQTLLPTGAASITADANTIMFAGANGPVVYARSNNATSWTKQSTSFAEGTAAFAVALSADGASGFAGNPQDTTVFPNQKYYDQDKNLVGTFPIGAVYGLGTGTPVVSPTGVATQIEFIKQPTPDSVYFRFTNGSGSARAVFVKEGSTGFPTTVNGATYIANAQFGQGTAAGAGWYCIYNGPHTRTDAAPLMAGLKPSTPYIIAIVEYNGKYGAEKYATTGATGKFVTDDLNIRAKNPVFTNVTGSTATLSWTNGSGVGRMVFMSTTPYDSGAGPSDVYYSPNAKYGSGNQANGYYCVYNGTGNSVNITGLTGGQRYRAIVYEYNGSTQSPKIISVYEVSESAVNVVTPISAPTGYATSLAFSNTTATTTTLTWVSSNGSARAVFLKLGTTGALNVTQGTTYAASSIFGQGDQAGTNGWYCVYNGTGNTVNLSGLAASSTYRAIVLEYNGTAGMEAYNLSRYNPANVTTTAAPATFLTANQKRMLVEQDVLADNLNGEVNVRQGMSPNSDGVNDVFTIDGIGFYPENTVQIMNSNGELVYSAAGYNNYSKVFDGHAANGTLQKAGTYFYSLEYKKGDGLVRKTGYLVIKY